MTRKQWLRKICKKVSLQIFHPGDDHNIKVWFHNSTARHYSCRSQLFKRRRCYSLNKSPPSGQHIWFPQFFGKTQLCWIIFQIQHMYLSNDKSVINDVTLQCSPNPSTGKQFTNFQMASISIQLFNWGQINNLNVPSN